MNLQAPSLRWTDEQEIVEAPADYAIKPMSELALRANRAKPLARFIAESDLS